MPTHLLSADAREALTLALGFGLGVVWLWAGVAKLRTPLDLDWLATMVPLPRTLLIVVRSTLPAVELGLGALLTLRVAVTAAAYASMALLALFAAVQVTALVRWSLTSAPEERAATVASCGCFGGGKVPVTSTAASADLATFARTVDRAAWHLARSLLLAVVALALVMPCPICRA